MHTLLIIIVTSAVVAAIVGCCVGFGVGIWLSAADDRREVELDMTDCEPIDG